MAVKQETRGKSPGLFDRSPGSDADCHQSRLLEVEGASLCFAALRDRFFFYGSHFLHQHKGDTSLHRLQTVCSGLDHSCIQHAIAQVSKDSWSGFSKQDLFTPLLKRREKEASARGNRSQHATWAK